jgi:hypothetical protein
LPGLKVLIVSELEKEDREFEAKIYEKSTIIELQHPYCIEMDR